MTYNYTYFKLFVPKGGETVPLYQPFNERRGFDERWAAAVLVGLCVVLGVATFLWSIPRRGASDVSVSVGSEADDSEVVGSEVGYAVDADDAGDEEDLFPAEEIPDEDENESGGPWRIEGVIRAGQGLAGALGAAGVPPVVAGNIVYNLEKLVDFRKIKTGDRYAVELSGEGALVAFELRTGPLSTYEIDNREGLWRSFKRAVQVEDRIELVRGEVSASLFEAVSRAGEGASLAAAFADILAWDFDFARGTRQGDRFSILFEKRYSEGEFVGYGRILAARYDSRGEVHEAFRYEGSGGRGAAYYDGEGRSIKKAFLKSPLRFSHISSGYTNARMHPILKYVRPHRGIDYAAPRGTPVWSVADGTIVFAGRKGQNGKTVVVRHAGGYETMYNHLSRYARGLRRGRKVRQKEVIGYVGSTGLSTGPHLDFRLKRRGRFINPLKEKLPRGTPVPKGEMAAFLKQKATLSGRLKG